MAFEGDPQADACDVLVVGAGPAGCVIASRLSEDPNRRVVLLEAGPDYGPDIGRWPLELRDPSDLPADSHPWGYRDHREAPREPLDLPRARVVGGSSTINACTWVRGSSRDYDAWATAVDDRWAFDELIARFRRVERDDRPGEFHGSTGPIPVTRVGADRWTPLDRAFVDAAQSGGYPFVEDLNGSRDQQPAVGPRPQNVLDDTRMNGAFTYLAQARARPNLAIVPEVLVDRVVIEGGAATGVIDSSGVRWRAGEVVLCAGAYSTPAILMRSGIGPADHLTEMGIDVVADQPGVGGNLLDHPLVIGALGPFDVAESGAPMADPPPLFPVMLRASTRGMTDEVDLNVFMTQWPNESEAGWSAQPIVALMHTRSTGSVRLASASAEDPPVIRHDHLSDAADLESMCDGIELVARLMATEPLASLLRPTADSMAWNDRPSLAAWLVTNVGTMFHPCATCRMGPPTDPLSVVDGSARVHGLRGLRIADASIFPSATTAAIHPSVVAVAERVADLCIAESEPARASNRA